MQGPLDEVQAGVWWCARLNLIDGGKKEGRTWSLSIRVFERSRREATEDGNKGKDEIVDAGDWKS